MSIDSSISKSLSPGSESDDISAVLLKLIRVIVTRVGWYIPWLCHVRDGAMIIQCESFFFVPIPNPSDLDTTPIRRYCIPRRVS